MLKPSIEILLKSLQASWGSDTCYEPAQWSPDNPARGQCVVSSLVIQNYLGGDLIRYKVTDQNGLNETHYCNVLPDGTILDSTGSQYKTELTLKASAVDLKGYASVREKRLAEKETRDHYELLLQRVEKYLQDTRN